MRLYQIPSDMNEKEKIVGGLFDLGQAFWLGGGFVLALLVFFVLNSFMGIWGAIFAFPIAFSGLPFVFYKPQGLTLFEYTKRKFEYKKKVKLLPFKRKKFDW